MFFALNTFLWQPRFGATDLRLLNHVASLGGDLIEIQCPDLRGFPAAEVASELCRIGIGIGCMASTWSRDPERRLTRVRGFATGKGSTNSVLLA